MTRFGTLFFRRGPLLTGGLLLVLLMAGLIFYTDLPGRSYSGPLPPLTQQERVLSRNLKAHVDYLAGEIGERNLSRYAELKAAARYIRETLARSGYRISEQEYTARGDGLIGLADDPVIGEEDAEDGAARAQKSEEKIQHYPTADS